MIANIQLSTKSCVVIRLNNKIPDVAWSVKVSFYDLNFRILNTLVQFGSELLVRSYDSSWICFSGVFSNNYEQQLKTRH
jgi:hypothetical protein